MSCGKADFRDVTNLSTATALFLHFIDFENGLAGDLYGRRIYEVMRYWDEDRPEWDVYQRDFARGLASASEMGRDVGDDTVRLKTKSFSG